jgi:AraC family transcriptional activator of pobA
MDNIIKSYHLDKNYLFVHKTDTVESNFGMDNTPELIENGFGIYSSKNVKSKIGPLKSLFYRIGFCRAGSLQVECGLETFTHSKDTIHFNFPGQLFSLNNVSSDMYSLYILFTAEFIETLIPSFSLQTQYPFLNYAGVPFFKLSEEEAKKTEQLFFEIDAEIKAGNPDMALAIKHLIYLILITAKRSYVRQQLTTVYHNAKASSLVTRYKKLVGEHFIKIRSVAEYASRLAVTPKHLSKVIKDETGKTPSDFINEMLMMEIKALLRHSQLNISEIAYQLDFSDPSHLSNFFKKHQGVTPQQYRNESA